MLLKDTLLNVARSQREELTSFEYGVEREELANIALTSPYATVISGIRRCGKSTLLRQLTKKVDNFYYFNFEDARITGFDSTDFQRLDTAFHEAFGDCDHYFFDEIQNVEKWELFVRSGLDRGKKFVLTGSNASLLSKELGTRLTGRHMRTELFPFSYEEALKLRQGKAGPSSLAEYLKKGGFPDYLRYERQGSLRELFNDLIERDIIVRYNIRETKTLKEIALYLLTNAGNEFSFNNLKKLFGMGSTTTVSSFISFFEDAYLLFTIPKFDYSLKKQLVSPKKVYSIDNGFSNANTASLSEDRERLLENATFLHLRKEHRDIFYFKKKNECDFVIKEKNRISAAFQVCYELDEHNKNREIDGLKEAMDEFKLKEGCIITFDQEDRFIIDEKEITVIPAWKWMSGQK
ncbi:MAG: ATP-binding protein [Candidatus Thermoplasmatota archaeon]|nr:ATP-binding protein [Candidatus Thermoplasmatota archaeon]